MKNEELFVKWVLSKNAVVILAGVALLFGSTFFGGALLIAAAVMQNLDD